MATKELMELKQKIKKKTPKFSRTDAHKKPKLKRTGWRKARGIQNKMRLQFRGYRRIVKKGYRTPRLLRGVGKDGKTVVMISNIFELGKVGENQKVIISASVGKKNKIRIIEECKKQKIVVANFKDPDAFVKEVNEKIALRKKEQEIKKERRQKKKEKAEKTKEKKEKSVEEKVDKEEKKAEEKKEKDKLLIQKDESQ